ncbi:Na+/H+ antiporter NhaC [Sporosarcina sp. FA9]|uniref:Na+/H+ antiporter NhaC n=1 Tax=Sporosarcina sp. FA9 TaxID=3413030 RepID=UPI003F654E40
MKQNAEKDIKFWMVLVPLFVMIFVMIVTVVKLEQGPHMPLIVGTITAAIIAWKAGFTWKEIEEMMYKGIRLALPAVVIIMLVGLTIGAWMGGGIVATMIYYGLQIITPSWFLVTIAIICSIVSLAIGSSWSTMATIGVAGMGIGLSMGIPAGMIAGAVISGSYFGDKMSPLSDTTNLAAGLTGTDLFDHIKHMLYTTIPGLVIALGVYAFLGRRFAGEQMDAIGIEQTARVLQDSFLITPLLLLVPLAVIVMVALKIPAIPALIVGIILGFLSQIFIQGGSTVGAIEALQSGFAIETGNDMVDGLFNGGGLDSMMYTVSMAIVAMTFGGILEFSGMLQSLMNQLLKVVKSSAGLISSTVAACVLTNATCSEQYVSIVVPSRMFSKAYKDKGLNSKNLSRALEDGGTLTSPLIPWNTCGVFILGTLGVGVVEYGPYAILNLVVPFISIFYAVTGFTIVKMTPEELAQRDLEKALENEEISLNQ